MQIHRFQSFLFIAVTLTLLTPGLGQSQCVRRSEYIQVERPSPPKVVQGFIAAVRTREPLAREAAVRGYLQSVLGTADWRTKSDLSGWLNGSFAILDPLPYEDLLEKIGCTTLLDWAELRRDRHLQMEYFGKALNEGHSYLPHGTMIAANEAVIKVAGFGLVELENDVRGFYTRTWTGDTVTVRNGKPGTLGKGSAAAFEQFKAKYPFGTFSLDLALHAGGRDYDDANRLAAQRLSEMPAADLRRYINDDVGFEGALWRIARYACAVNPFTDKQRDACEDIMKVYVHQVWSQLERTKAGEPAVWPKGLAELGQCFLDHILFSDYAGPREYFQSPEQTEHLNRIREWRKKALEAAVKKKDAAEDNASPPR